MIDEKTKAKIDAMTYEQMRWMWIFQVFCDKWFQGEVGEYFGKVMTSKRRELTKG